MMPESDEALVQRALDVAGGRLHGERADDRGDDRDAAEHERVQRDLRDVVVWNVRTPSSMTATAVTT